jgi:hypothetical protein
MRVTRDLLLALMLDLVGILLLLLGVLGYVGVIEPLAKPEMYLTCAVLGLVASALAMPRLFRAVRDGQSRERPPRG